MESKVDRDLLQNEIIEDMKIKFGIRVNSVSPIAWNYGNVCWLMNSDGGAHFVKVLDKIRNKRTMDNTRQALRYQDQMHYAGIPCQPVLSYNGDYSYVTLKGEEYTITGASEGQHIEAGQANPAQMYTLGKATGLMHNWLKNNLPQLESLHWELKSKEDMIIRLEKNLQETMAHHNSRYADAIKRQLDILRYLDLDELRTCSHGWAHWDMHIDNLMFQEDRVADIIDFDRISYVYTDFDISRALLSCTLTSKGFPIENVKAYVDGYSECTRLTAERIVRSLKLTWYKECKWTHAKYSKNRPMSRFIEELIWVGDNWDLLEDIFNGIINHSNNNS
jgi:homoserine kinase type II